MSAQSSRGGAVTLDFRGSLGFRQAPGLTSNSLSKWSLVGSVRRLKAGVFIGVGGRQPAGAIYETYLAE